MIWKFSNLSKTRIFFKSFESSDVRHPLCSYELEVNVNNFPEFEGLMEAEALKRGLAGQSAQN